jgi:hypothetical protein
MNFVNYRQLTNVAHNSSILQGIKMPSLASVEGHLRPLRRPDADSRSAFESGPTSGRRSIAASQTSCGQQPLGASRRCDVAASTSSVSSGTGA